jgi:hypothetical protein
MHPETVSADCLQLINNFSQTEFISNFYLAGGTALALQLGHRISIDLDWFSTKEFSPTFATALKQAGTVKNLRISTNNLRCYIKDVKVEFMYFGYPPRYDFTNWNGINLLHPIDIGLFKLLALLGRSQRKDIIDLYFIDKHVINLEDLFVELIDNYALGDVNLFKQLELMFDDEAVNNSIQPDMLMAVEFDTAYTLVKEKVTRSIRNYFHI